MEAIARLRLCSLLVVALFMSVRPLILFARLCAFARRRLAIFFGSASTWAASKRLPIPFGYVDPIMMGRLLDISESKLPVLIRYVDILIEARDRVPDVARVG